MAVKKCAAFEKLIHEGWFTDEKEILPWVMAGRVFIDDKPLRSMKERVPENAAVRVREYYKRRYVNKGGLKLQGAIDDFGINPSEKPALDCGASTGGFTDCLLKNGASRVYAVDAGYGQLAGNLINDPRVINMERTNLADETLLRLDPAPQLITLDLSYLSLRDALPLCRGILRGGGDIIALVKPIFETGSADIRRSGEINDRELHIQILTDLCDFICGQSFSLEGITFSPVRGNGGTVEYFFRIMYNNHTGSGACVSYREIIPPCVTRALETDAFDRDSYMPDIKT